jgi:hypothetical protein
MTIIFRTCDVVNAVNNAPRPFGLDKKTLIKVCFKSMYHAAKATDNKIIILGDKLSDEMVEFFSHYPVTFSNGNYGNDESIRQTLKIADTLPDDEWIYFCEDDYLHHPDTFKFTANLITQKANILQLPEAGMFRGNKINTVHEIAIFPPDYPDRYLPKYMKRQFIFHTTDCHWRQVEHTTFTLFMQANTVKKYLPVFAKASIGANDSYLSKTLFTDKVLCLSPLPGLSTHMHVDTMTPLVDWEKIKDHYLDV